jgi:hypothetical protein
MTKNGQRPPEIVACAFCGETIEGGGIDPCSLTFVPGPDPANETRSQHWGCHAACLEKTGIAMFDAEMWE